MDSQIKKFLASSSYAVAGASNDRQKYGNKVLRCYIQHNMKVYPVHPTEDTIEGIQSHTSVTQLPKEVQSLSIVTPPKITEKIVAEAIKKGIPNIWMQPGAESREAIQMCKEKKINIIAGGPCLLVVLGFKE